MYVYLVGCTWIVPCMDQWIGLDSGIDVYLHGLMSMDNPGTSTKQWIRRIHSWMYHDGKLGTQVLESGNASKICICSCSVYMHVRTCTGS